MMYLYLEDKITGETAHAPYDDPQEATAVFLRAAAAGLRASLTINPHPKHQETTP